MRGLVRTPLAGGTLVGAVVGVALWFAPALVADHTQSRAGGVKSAQATAKNPAPAAFNELTYRGRAVRGRGFACRERDRKCLPNSSLTCRPDERPGALPR